MITYEVLRFLDLLFKAYFLHLFSGTSYAIIVISSSLGPELWSVHFNSLTSKISGCNFKWIISTFTSWCVITEKFPVKLPGYVIKDQSTLIQVMAWPRQIMPYRITRPQCVHQRIWCQLLIPWNPHCGPVMPHNIPRACAILDIHSKLLLNSSHLIKSHSSITSIVVGQ